ncbi:MAG TPA: hypothetical protein DCX77_05920 [Acidimicrobiaceae bacterium]|nr:hypothetical protein [Acidimicrobiaceae bacterium]|tara:strand:+ start:1741 stop:3186 length:1446 start_codon:yes stop_codon:yes gene_type:complete
MAKRLGSNLGRNLGLPSIKRPVSQGAKGLYPRAGTGAGQYGSVQFPTIVEQYNRESDFKRWKLGQEYYFGKGRTWGDRQFNILARFLNQNPSSTADELEETGSREVVTLFPSSSSPEGAWYVATRVRGSFLLPQPIQASALTYNQTDPDPNNHTFTYDVTGIYNGSQLGIFNVCIGDQFEDSASGPSFPGDLVEKDIDSVAFTLIGVSVGSMTLTFDLSKPQRRVKRNGNIYWKKEKYDPDDPSIPTLTWKGDGTKHLCSSFSFFCCCPDCLGGAVANLDDPEPKATLETFPLPNANRSVFSAWERQGVGYYRQWRTLPERKDQRRECKHIHAQRWACGVPWLEPDDYPTAIERDLLEFSSAYEKALDPEEYMDYFRNRRLSFDRFVLTIAESAGLVIFPGGDVRDNIRPFGGPMLWNDKVEPLSSWCRNNDWWMERGTQNLKCFNATTQQFQEIVPKSGTDYPILNFLSDSDPLTPKIVP